MSYDELRLVSLEIVAGIVHGIPRFYSMRILLLARHGELKDFLGLFTCHESLKGLDLRVHRRSRLLDVLNCSLNYSELAYQITTSASFKVSLSGSSIGKRT